MKLLVELRIDLASIIDVLIADLHSDPLDEKSNELICINSGLESFQFLQKKKKLIVASQTLINIQNLD